MVQPLAMWTFIGVVALCVTAYLIIKANSTSRDDSRISATEADDQPEEYQHRSKIAPGEMKEIYPVVTQLDLDYIASSDDAPHRRITTQHYSPDPPGYIFAWCHLRDDERTFRLDRIRSAVALDSGEVINDVGKYLTALYEKSPAAVWRMLLAEHLLALRALVFIAKSDETFTTKERDILLLYVQLLVGRADLTRPELIKALKSLPDTNLKAFQQVCSQLAHYPTAYRSALLETAQSIVKSQRTIEPQEQEAFDFLVKKIGHP